MKKSLKLCLYVVTAILTSAYMINDGFYVLSKIGASKLELINRYTVIQFPRNTVIEKFKIENDYMSRIFSATTSIWKQLFLFRMTRLIICLSV